MDIQARELDVKQTMKKCISAASSISLVNHLIPVFSLYVYIYIYNNHYEHHRIY